MPPIEVEKIARAEPWVVKSAGRVLELLEYFELANREVRVGDIVKDLGFPQSSTSALLKSLVELGYMTFDRVKRTYFPSRRIALLGTSLKPINSRNGPLQRLMHELSQELQDTIVLAARNGIYAQYIRVIQAKKTIRFHIPVGVRRLLVRSAAGFALLADASEDEIKRLVVRAKADPNIGRKDISFRDVMTRIAEAKRLGYSISRGLVTPGGGQIAMRLGSLEDGHVDQLVVGVSAVLPNLDKNRDDIVSAMNEAIRRYRAAR